MRFARKSQTEVGADRRAARKYPTARPAVTPYLFSSVIARRLSADAAIHDYLLVAPSHSWIAAVGGASLAMTENGYPIFSLTLILESITLGLSHAHPRRS